MESLDMLRSMTFVQVAEVSLASLCLRMITL